MTDSFFAELVKISAKMPGPDAPEVKWYQKWKKNRDFTTSPGFKVVRSNLNPFLTARRGAVSGAALGAAIGIGAALSHNQKGKERDIQAKLSPKDRKKTKALRMGGAAIDTGMNTALGAGAGALVGKGVTTWRKGTDPQTMYDEAFNATDRMVHGGINGVRSGVKKAVKDMYGKGIINKVKNIAKRFKR
jgi:hypothetical protein